jgi:hypothetical protein
MSFVVHAAGFSLNAAGLLYSISQSLLSLKVFGQPYAEVEASTTPVKLADATKQFLTALSEFDVSVVVQDRTFRILPEIRRVDDADIRSAGASWSARSQRPTIDPGKLGRREARVSRWRVSVTGPPHGFSRVEYA